MCIYIYIYIYIHIQKPARGPGAGSRSLRVLRRILGADSRKKGSSREALPASSGKKALLDVHDDVDVHVYFLREHTDRLLV